MVNRLHSKMRTIARTLGIILVITAGSVLPDLDHILPPYKRSWGHDWRIPCLILLIVALAFIGRLVITWILRRKR